MYVYLGMYCYNANPRLLKIETNRRQVLRSKSFKYLPS